jgi:hypothetical protein
METLHQKHRLYCLILLFSGFSLLVPGTALIAQTSVTWSFNRTIDLEDADHLPYHDAVAGNFFNDFFQSVAVLAETGTSMNVRIMAAPLVYDPPVLLDARSDVLAMELFPGGSPCGAFDSLAVSDASGVYNLYWSHSEVCFKTDMIAAVSSVHHLRVGDVDKDGSVDVVCLKQTATGWTLLVYCRTPSGQWQADYQFTGTGKVDDMEILQYEAGTERQIAMVREFEGLDIFDLNGTSLRHEFHLSFPQYPDSLARLEQAGGGLDMLLWITGTGTGSDQFLFRLSDDTATEILYVGNLVITHAAADLDYDGDGDFDPVLLNIAGYPLCLLSDELQNPTGNWFSVAATDVVFLELDATAGPFPDMRGAMAICDADGDGDTDAYLPRTNQSGSDKLVYFQNDEVNIHTDQRVFMQVSEWDIRPDADDTMTAMFELGVVPDGREFNCIEIPVYVQENPNLGIERIAIQHLVIPFDSLPGSVQFELPTFGIDINDSQYNFLLRLARYDEALERVVDVGPVHIVHLMMSRGYWDDYHPDPLLLTSPRFEFPVVRDPGGFPVNTHPRDPTSTGTGGGGGNMDPGGGGYPGGT